MNNRYTALIFLLILIAGIALTYYFKDGIFGKKSVVIKGLVGGEKQEFLKNPEVVKILSKKYGLIIDHAKAGSIEMVKEELKPEIDFLWPSSQVALEIFKLKTENTGFKNDIVFNTPIVLYSWNIVTEALIKQNIVEKINDSYYIVDFPKLVNLILTNKNWKDIGLNDLYGKIHITSTDPSKSNSGNMFSGLLANILNNGNVADEASLKKDLPVIRSIFSKLGYMEHSSSDLFEGYLKKGVGDKPLIAGYENQIIEFSLQYKDLWPKLKEKIRILYLKPTVWSSHPVIIINDKAKALIEALQDKDIQRLAWEKHGFRTGMLGVQNDPKILSVVGIPSEITSVMPMPGPAVMDKIIEEIANLGGTR